MLQTKADIGISGKVKDDIDAVQQLDQRIHFKQVAAYQRECRACCGLHQKFSVSGCEVVQTNDGLSVRQQAVGKMTADEPGTTRYQTLHKYIPVVDGRG